MRNTRDSTEHQCNGASVRSGSGQVFSSMSLSGLNEMRPNLDQIDAGLEGRWRTNEQLPLAAGAGGTYFDQRHKCLHLNEDDERCGDGEWGGGVQGDAERAVISVSIDRVNVSYLDEGEQGK